MRRHVYFSLLLLTVYLEGNSIDQEKLSGSLSTVC